jgi:hypothetical protein
VAGRNGSRLAGSEAVGTGRLSDRILRGGGRQDGRRILHFLKLGRSALSERIPWHSSQRLQGLRQVSSYGFLVAGGSLTG